MVKHELYSESILECIGNTPLVKMQGFLRVYLNKEDFNLTKGTGSKKIPSPGIYGKCELFNPMSSVKDRIGLSMIEAMEKTGKLKEGVTIVESTSGNTGIALGLVTAVKGYKLICTMPESMSIERRKILRALGAEIVLTPASQGMKGANAKAKEIVEKSGGTAILASQFTNPANPYVHFSRTGYEIFQQLGFRTPDIFVAGVGTGGTVSGVGRILNQLAYPGEKVRVVAVEPEESPVLSGGEPGPHKIQGIGAGFVPEVYDKTVVDEVRTVNYERAVKTARLVARYEGIFCGVSSGANIGVAAELAKENPEAVIVVVIPDTGERYLTTELWDL
ncbi:MAG: cysteine synthase A [Promethearchaeota archaeon]